MVENGSPIKSWGQRLAENYFLALVMSMGAMFLPLVNWLGLSWAVLMVLRENFYRGVLSWGIVSFFCFYALSGLQFHFHLNDIISWMSFAAPLWAMAYTLRLTRALSTSLQVGFALMLLMSLLSYWHYGPTSYAEIYEYLSNRLFAGTVSADPAGSSMQQLYLQAMSTSIVLAWGALLFVLQVSLLFIARYLQSRWYYPGGFQKEFHALRLSRFMTPVFVLTFLWAGFFPEVQVAVQLAVLSVILLCVAGIAWLHWYIKFRQMGSLWLAIMYLLMFVLSAWVLPVLVLIAILDTHLDLKKRVQQKKR